MGYLTPEGVENVANYKYISGTYSLVDNLFNPFWLSCAAVVPRHISPNALTLIGLTSMSVGLLVVITMPGPRLPCLLFSAFSIFAYQTLDAMDGKHARNTGQSSPLGALFDHGCDCVAMVVESLIVELSILPQPGGVDAAWKLCVFVAWYGGMLGSFFASQWEHYHVHRMEAAGVTEAQLAAISVVALEALLGPGFWAQPWHLGLLEGDQSSVMTLRVAGLIGSGLFGLLIVAAAIWRTVQETNGLACLKSFLPFVLNMGSAVALFSSSDYLIEEFLDHALIYTAVGLSFSDIALRLVISGISKVPYPSLHPCMLPISTVALIGLAAPGFCGPKTLMCLIAWQAFSILWVASDTIAKVCERCQIPFLAPIKKAAE